MIKEDGANEEVKCDALIRATFGKEGKDLQVSKRYEMYAQAVWLESWRLRNLAEMLAGFFDVKR